MLVLVSAPPPSPRPLAAAFLLGALLLLWLVTRLLARHASKPAVLWCMAGYLGLIHLVALAGLLTGQLFADSFPQLTLLTFPFSLSVSTGPYIPGFATLRDLGTNYVRYISLFGTMNSLILGGFLAFVVPDRTASRSQRQREP
jgi:hypothetical protein